SLDVIVVADANKDFHTPMPSSEQATEQVTESQPIRPDRAVMDYDVVIVSAGPAGLACAIRLKQLNPECNVCVLEKGSGVGAHLLSGAVFETRALDELIPDWKERGAPIHVPAREDRFMFLTKKAAIRLPTPPQMHNKGNYII